MEGVRTPGSGKLWKTCPTCSRPRQNWLPCLCQMQISRHPGAWRTHLRAGRTSLAPEPSVHPTAISPMCSKVVVSCGMGDHLSRAHQHFRLARLYCTGTGVCPVCQVGFHTLLRYSHMCNTCLGALMDGVYHETVTTLDAADARSRKKRP